MSDKMKKSIRNKLMSMSVTVALIAIVLLSLVSWNGFSDMQDSSETMSKNLVNVSSLNSEEIIEKQVLDDLTTLAKATANIVDARIYTLVGQLEILASSIEELYANPSSFGRIPVLPPNASNKGKFVSQVVYANGVDPASVADEVALIGNMGIVMNHVSETLTGASSTHIGTESGFTILCDDVSDLKVDMGYLDPTTRSWYTSAVESGQSTWSEVFEDSYGRGMAITCGHPIYDPYGNIKAVVAIGSQLSEISSAIADISIGETGSVIVIDNNGDVIMGDSFINKDIVDSKVNFLSSKDPILVDATKKMMNGESGIAITTMDGADTYIVYHPMQSIPWSVVTLVHVDEIMAPVVQGKQQTSALAVSAQIESDKIAKSTLVAMLAGMMASAVSALLVGVLYSNKIASPIRKLEAGVREISRGKLDFALDIKTGDEIENLAAAFNSMTSDLKKHIQDLTTVTAEREKIGAELSIATEIQASMLPSVFPAFPDYKEFDIYASMLPAKEVGGDFYDFFLVDERHLGIVMADVSGKGVPAALFMVIAKTLIKNYAQKGECPCDIMTHTNNQLFQNNDASMFVTAWTGILNLDTGELVFSNAGHNPPLIKRNNGDFEYLKTDSGFVLAGLEDFKYTQSSITLNSLDVLYLYTDGVTEATNVNNELYSDERLLNLINSIKIDSTKDLLEKIKCDIDCFVGDAPQFDDITMLGLKFLKDN